MMAPQQAGVASQVMAPAQFGGSAVVGSQVMAPPLTTQAAVPSFVAAAGQYSVTSAPVVSYQTAAPVVSYSTAQPVMSTTSAITAATPVGSMIISEPRVSQQVGVGTQRMDLFDLLDRNHDGVVSRSEFTQGTG